MGELRGRWLFLRGLALCHLLAFLSLAPQLEGLLGETGILPAAQYLDRVARDFGPERFYLVPTILWFDASDPTLVAAAALGVGVSLLVLFGFWPRLGFLLLWALYLSISSVGRAFLAFQWDILLLEATVLAVLLSPGGLRPGLGADDPPRPLALGAGRLLLFKLMFLSGWAKYASQDPTWRDLSALTFHYQTQPLPTPLGWLAHQLPLGIHQASALLMFGIQLLAPFLLFLPARGRRWAVPPLLLLQLLIGLTGNYGFFNLLAVVLMTLALDDATLQASLPNSLRALWREVRPKVRPAHLRDGLAGVLLALQLALLFARFAGGDRLPGPIAATLDFFRPFRSLNNYGLFAVMTTERREIVIEGSRDGQTWVAYGLPFQPGPLERAPVWAGPHMPRLDWQLWFAALGEVRDNPWIPSLLARLGEGAPGVRRLLWVDPFGDDPPIHLRAQLYRYRFTTSAERERSGQWWAREPLGLYYGPITVDP